jgi:hypothetical protein
VLIVLASKSVTDFEIVSIDSKCPAPDLVADHQQGEEATDPEAHHQALLPEKAKARWLNSWK